MRFVENPTLEMSLVPLGSFVEFRDDEGHFDYGVVVNKGSDKLDKRFEVRIASFPRGWRKFVKRDVFEREVRVVSDDFGLRALKAKCEALYEVAHDLGGHEGIVFLRAWFQLNEYIKQLNFRPMIETIDAVLAVPPGPGTDSYVIMGQYATGRRRFVPGRQLIEPLVLEDEAMSYFNRDREVWALALEIGKTPTAFFVYRVPEEGKSFVRQRLRIKYNG